MSFTHLHVTTTFSPGHGTAAPAELAAAAAMQGATALACTDHDGLYGAVDHVVACRTHGLAPLLGVNLAVLEPDDGRARGRVSGRVVVLAHGGGEGYRALCRLVADAHVHTAGRAGVTLPTGVTRQELAARAVDPGSGLPLLTVLLGPESDIGLAMQGPRYLRPRTLFKEWLAAMPTGTVAAEVVSHHADPGSTFTTGHAARMLKLAREHHIPAILSNAVRHLSSPVPAPQERPVQESPTRESPASSASSSPRLALAPAGRDLRRPAGSQAFLKNMREMEQTARGICHAADLRVKDLEQLLEDTRRLTESCRLDPVTDLGWGTDLLPDATVLGLTMTPQAELAERCHIALERDASGLPAADGLELRERVARELDVIETRGAASFYLAAAEVTATIRGLGIRVSGRSWATASAVAYFLGISSVSPLGLAPQSGSPTSASAAAPDGADAPDGAESDVFPPLELDLEAGGLREVHRALARRFGKDRVCLLGTAPAADTGLEASPRAGGEGALIEVSDPSGSLPGGLSRRSSGVLLGDTSLLHRIPTQPGGAGLPLSQYAPGDLGHWGFLRVTLRESAAQTVIARTLRRIQGQETTAGLTPGEAEPSEESLALLGSEQSPFAPTDPADVLAARHVTWLRSHHPAEFIAACWDSPAVPAPQNVLRAEARNLGIPVLPLDVNRSAEECEAEDHRETPDDDAANHEGPGTPEKPRAHERPGTPEKPGPYEKPGTQGSSRSVGLRPGLRDVPGLSAAERKRLVAGRPYHSVDELFTRAAVSRATVRKLAEAGALDSLCGPGGGQEARAALVRNLQELAHRPAGGPRVGVLGQLTLPLGDSLEVHDGEGLVTGSPVEGAPETDSYDDAAADPEAADSEAGAEAAGGMPAGLAAVVGAPRLSRVRTPAPSEFPPPTSHTPDPVRRTGSG
ncbi:hypothetical protein QFZ52_003191 [Arthrobacter woluwensis]|uniref:PHP domain-containing protein n=1 Tax=Arthrobacter woluwensis TaxID=156980 RepID=UPI00278B0B7A|nr:PHP domain-containing protein [Arthrobacter woluwensis]MDQ0710539.1 hypothetical protein [Arthrobacter woluwensis]